MEDEDEDDDEDSVHAALNDIRAPFMQNI